MKRFLLVFEDLLGAHRHDSPAFSRTRVAKESSKEALIIKLGLVRCTRQERELYWNGENGEVLIGIEEMPEVEEIVSSKGELSELVWRFHRHWY